jgi:hypothetical protein
MVGSLKTVAGELARYKLRVVVVEGVRGVEGGSQPASRRSSLSLRDRLFHT